MIINMVGGGGGAALNFDVVRYATESELLAATPKANSIGIISTTEMTGWIIDANQPENMTNGMVWISVGTSSAIEFNALKENGIQVYPISAKQYISGALMTVEAKIYQNGGWSRFYYYFFQDGLNVYKNWTTQAVGWKSQNPKTEKPIITEKAGYTQISISTGYTGGIFIFPEKVNLTNVNQITFDGVINNVWTDTTATGVFVWSNIGTYYSQNIVAATAVSYDNGIFDGTTYIDTSHLDGDYYLGVALNDKGSYIKIRNLHLE